MIEQNVAEIEANIADACRRAGRDPGDVRLVAVSKKQSAERIQEAVDAGLRCFGESRVQEAAQKIPACPAMLEWHLIGHLQRNKVRHAVELFDFIHSVDSARLLETLEQACAEGGKRLPVCLEVNVAGDSAKFGVSPDELPGLLVQANAFVHLEIVGLMTMPPFTPDPEAARPVFAQLRELRDAMRAETGYELPELSMGMSRDYPAAIAEGATLIRLGTVLFRERD